jgi:hypothetical protein
LHFAAYPLILKLLFWKQREKRDAKVGNEMPSEQAGNPIQYYFLTQNGSGGQSR